MTGAAAERKENCLGKMEYAMACSFEKKDAQNVEDGNLYMISIAGRDRMSSFLLA